MKIEISGKFPKSTQKILRAAVYATDAHAPMNISLLRVLPVKKSQRDETAGYASLTGYVGTVRIDHTADDYLDTLFHECYHLHQMGRGDLVQEYGGFKWRGVFISVFVYKLFYKFIPFERQAYAYAAKMVKRLDDMA